MQTDNNISSGASKASDFQQAAPIQSKSTQPKALNPNQLNTGITLKVDGASASPTTQTASTNSSWPFVALGIFAVVVLVGFVIVVVRILKSPIVVETLEPTPKPSKNKATNNKKKKKRR